MAERRPLLPGLRFAGRLRAAAERQKTLCVTYCWREQPLCFIVYICVCVLLWERGGEASPGLSTSAESAH